MQHYIAIDKSYKMTWAMAFWNCCYYSKLKVILQYYTGNP